MDQKPFRTMILWTLWASAAMGIYLTLYNDTEVWSFLETDTSRITWLILGLFVVGLVGSFVLALMVTKESYRASQLDIVARKGGLKAIIVHSTRRAADRFFKSIQSTIESKGKPEVETLLTVELAFYERISSMIELVGNLLITMGLIGTVMGLTFTLTGLTGSLEALGHDQEMLLAGLRKAMAGMGTAFYTTLLGAVLGGVLLRMFAQINQHGVESLHDNLLRICLVYCSADYAHTLERDVRELNNEVSALEANVQRLEQAFSNSHQTMNLFREEVRHLNEENVSDRDGHHVKPMHALIEEHRRYCEALRMEMQMLAHMKRPWYIRLWELVSPPGNK
jgi:Tfp pilus assembly protein PilN